jgi:hypothetical protein
MDVPAVKLKLNAVAPARVAEQANRVTLYEVPGGGGNENTP